MSDKIDFMIIKDNCPMAYKKFKEFLIQYEYGNICHSHLETWELYGMGAIKTDYQVQIFFGWLDKFFSDNGIIINLAIEHRERIDKYHVQHDAGIFHFVEMTDTIDIRERKRHFEAYEYDKRDQGWIEGFTEGFYWLESRLQAICPICDGDGYSGDNEEAKCVECNGTGKKIGIPKEGSSNATNSQKG